MTAFDPISLTIAIVAVAFSGFIYWEARKQRKLTEVMVESLAYIQKRSTPRRSSSAGRQRTSASASQESTAALMKQTQIIPNARPAPSPAEQARIVLAAQREERERLELQLRQQREQWKRQKDIAKAIGWVLDRIGSDDEEEGKK